MRAPVPSMMDTLFGSRRHYDEDPRMIAATAAAQYYGLDPQKEAPPVSRSSSPSSMP